MKRLILFSVASYAVADLFLFTVTLVFADNPLFLATIPSSLAFVRPTTFVTSILAIIPISKKQVLPGIGRPSAEQIHIISGLGMRLHQRQQRPGYD
jgi:hypothetical protein